MPSETKSCREAFQESVRQLVEVVEQIPEDAWERVGLGSWNVRELVAHIVRIIDRTAAYAGAPGTVDTESAAAYYVHAMSRPGANEAIAARARASVGLLGDDPARAARTIGERTLAVVGTLDDDAPVVTPFGTLRLADYLPTRILEIVLHTLDVARAVGISVVPARSALTVTLSLLAEIAVEHGDGVAVALALSGRQPLPDGYSPFG